MISARKRPAKPPEFLRLTLAERLDLIEFLRDSLGRSVREMARGLHVSTTCIYRTLRVADARRPKRPAPWIHDVPARREAVTEAGPSAAPPPATSAARSEALGAAEARDDDARPAIASHGTPPLRIREAVTKSSAADARETELARVASPATPPPAAVAHEAAGQRCPQCHSGVLFSPLGSTAVRCHVCSPQAATELRFDCAIAEAAARIRERWPPGEEQRRGRWAEAPPLECSPVSPVGDARTEA